MSVAARQAPEGLAVAVKVPAVTLGFWWIKILATTLGETGGDAVSMSMGVGYAIATMIFMGLFVVAAIVQVRADDFRPWRYWTVIVASTTVGTTLADGLTRTLGIGYPGGASLLFAMLLVVLAAWRFSAGPIEVAVRSSRAEAFYWVTILCSQSLGTALGDWVADGLGLGYAWAALLFGAGLAAVAVAWVWARRATPALFWAAFVLTRPLGAVIGDFLDKPLAHGGLALDRFGASIVLALMIVLAIVLIPQRRARAHH